MPRHPHRLPLPTLRATGLCLLLVLLGIGAAAATPVLRSLDGAVRDLWSTSNGLPHNTVNALAQSADGYLWVATWEGLVRYNGSEFAAFDRRSVPGWPDDGVRALLVAADGALWVGTARGGLARLHRGEWSFPAPARGLVTDLLQDRAGRIWIATEAHGVERIDQAGGRQIIDQRHGLPAMAVFALHEAADGGSTRAPPRVSRGWTNAPRWRCPPRPACRSTPCSPSTTMARAGCCSAANVAPGNSVPTGMPDASTCRWR